VHKWSAEFSEFSVKDFRCGSTAIAVSWQAKDLKQTDTMDAEFWNNRYAAAHFVYGEAPNAFVAAMAPRIPDGPVLCLAEGEGRNAVHLATLGHAVTAVDQSEMGLAKARKLAAARGVQVATVLADLERYSIAANAWAGIVATFAHLPPPLRRRVHREAALGLQPGGVFVLEAYTPAQLAFGTGGPKAPELLMTLAALREELSGLELLVAQELEREVVEGDGHTGRSAVVQILAIAFLGVKWGYDSALKHVRIAGWLLLAVAAIYGLAGTLALGRNLTPFPKPSGRTRLVQRGIYALVRHPLYAAVICSAMGWSLLRASWPALGGSAVLALLLDAKARREEQWLRRQFPEYVSYQERVKRFLPWIY